MKTWTALLLPATCVALQQSWSLHMSRPSAAAFADIRMVDPALVAESSSTILPALIGAPAAIDPHYDPHTLSNLVPDIFNTCLLATVGLMGAYVTQGTEGMASNDDNLDAWEPTVPRRQVGGAANPFDDDDADEAFLRR